MNLETVIENQEQIYSKLLDCKNIGNPEEKVANLLDIIESYVKDRETVIQHAITIKAN